MEEVRSQKSEVSHDLPFSKEINQLEHQLRQLEDRFTILYQAHFGPWSGGGGEPPARKARLKMKPEAERLIAESSRRAEERAKIISDYRLVRGSATQLANKTHDELARLQQQVSKLKNAPRFDPTPGFAKNPPATIKADGAPTGILFGNAGGGVWHSSRINPAIDVLGFDYETGGYDPYDGDRFQNQAEGETYAVQLARSGANGQKSTTIIPCAVDRMMANPAHLWKKWLDEPNEFIWNEKENYSNPPEEVIRAAGSRNLWRMIAWGRSAITLYSPTDSYGGSSYNNFMVFESGYQFLRRCGGVIDTASRRLRSMEDIWLHAPIVEPQIAASSAVFPCRCCLLAADMRLRSRWDRVKGL